MAHDRCSAASYPGSPHDSRPGCRHLPPYPDLANARPTASITSGIIATASPAAIAPRQALGEIAPRLQAWRHRLAIHPEPLRPTPGVARFLRLIRRLNRTCCTACARPRVHPLEDRRPPTPSCLYAAGGSLAFSLSSSQGALYTASNASLMNSTDLFLFESAFARTPISAPSAAQRTVRAFQRRSPPRISSVVKPTLHRIWSMSAIPEPLGLTS